MDNVRTETRGRPAKVIQNPSEIITIVIQFLMNFIPETLAKRIVCLLFIVAGLNNKRITELTGVSERSVISFRSAINKGDIDNLFVIEKGAGRPGKAKGLESAIIEELEKNNYHTRQQIADMIKEKFDVSMSVSAVGKLLKKTASDD